MTKPETVRKAGLALGCVGTILILSIPIPIIPMAWAMVKAGYEYRHLESRMQSTVDAEEVREWARALLVKYPKDDAVPMQLKAEDLPPSLLKFSATIPYVSAHHAQWTTADHGESTVTIMWSFHWRTHFEMFVTFKPDGSPGGDFGRPWQLGISYTKHSD